MSDEEYFNEMITSEKTIPAIRNDHQLRSRLLEILKEMDSDVAREICEAVLMSNVLKDPGPKKGDSFAAGWGVIGRNNTLRLSIRRDVLIWESDFRVLDDGRQVMEISVPMEGIVNLLNEEAAFIEVSGTLSESGAGLASTAHAQSMTPTPRRYLVPIEDREPSEE